MDGFLRLDSPFPSFHSALHVRSCLEMDHTHDLRSELTSILGYYRESMPSCLFRDFVDPTVNYACAGLCKVKSLKHGGCPPL